MMCSVDFRRLTRHSLLKKARRGHFGPRLPLGCVQTWTRRRVRVDEFWGRVANPVQPALRKLVNVRISPLYDRNVNYKDS